ncbi:hypothetical protein [Streptomyces sp. NPDC012825]|uniref:hypothetical protein n=1 Tax=Streptomyces sp. NPDC012825 TaxID=3364851 RepID=UPI003682F46D
MPVRKGTPALLSAGTLCAALLLTACGTPAAPPAPTTTPARTTTPAAAPAPAPADGARPAPGAPGGAVGDPAAAPQSAARLPGVGPVLHASVPDGTSQALVVIGASADSSSSTATLYSRDPATGWKVQAGPWPTHNALRGWTADHTAGDLRTPIGVFRLGDAGGRLPDPGALLPYDRDDQFAISGTGFLGEPLEGSFDHVIAIDYNRVPGRSPLDRERPLGAEKGGGVWIHVDHDGPTQACVTLEREDLRELLRALDPAREPVVVMGPATELAR